MLPSINITFSTHAAPYHTPTSVLHDRFTVVVLDRFTPNMLESNTFILVSSDQRMCSQYSSGFFSCSLAKYNLAVLCQRPRKGNFLGRCP